MTEETTPTGKGATTWLTWGFAAFGIVAAIAVIFLAAVVVSFMSRAPRAPVQVAGKTASEQYSVQDVEDVYGTNLLKIEIGLGDRSGGSYSSRTPDLRNLVLLDKASGASRRLLSGNDRQIARSDFLPAAAMVRPVGAQGETLVEDSDSAGPEAKKAAPPMAYYAVQVHQKDGVLIDVLIGNLASGSQAWLLRGIDGIDRMWMIDATHLGLLMRQGMRLQYRVIDVPQLKVVTAKPVDLG